MVTRAAGVRRVPGLQDGLVDRVDPAAVGDGETESGAEGGRVDGEGEVVELEGQ